MPRQPKKERVSGRYFNWLLGTRDGVFYADGRSNPQKAGRHSLGTRDRTEALAGLQRLDLVVAVQHGLADRSVLQSQEALLPLAEGQRRYLDYVARPVLTGGARPSSVKRYRAVLDKFVAFAQQSGCRHWQEVNKGLLQKYSRWLAENDYRYATQYLELTTLKQVIKWLVGEGLLPAGALVTLKLRKPRDTTTHCYTAEQVRSIVTQCYAMPDLDWLGDAVVALATTGLRIGELANLRWSDVDFERGMLRLRDTTRQSSKAKRADVRATKSHRDRSLPIHEDLMPILKRLPHHNDGRVFHGPKGGQLKPDTVRTVLIRRVLHVLKERFPANADGPGIGAGRLHGFRHYFCSESADSGVPEQMLMTWMGHEDSLMIRHYYHAHQDEARRQMAKLRVLRSQPSGD